MPPVIFDKLVNHCRFKNINGLIFKPISFNEFKNEITVEVYLQNGTYSHPETWDDLDTTVTAFKIGEYLFID